MVFNTTFNNISAILWRSVIFVGENGGMYETHVNRAQLPSLLDLESVVVMIVW
jgi:hypothetical protein